MAEKQTNEIMVLASEQEMKRWDADCSDIQRTNLTRKVLDVAHVIVLPEEELPNIS